MNVIAAVGAAVTILAFILGIPMTVYLTRRAIQTPIREQLDAMTKERDYFRSRVDSLEDFIRNSGRKAP